MKHLSPAFVLTALALAALTASTHLHISFTDVQAAIAWNLSVVLAVPLVFAAQMALARERQLPRTVFFTMMAVASAAMVLGARAGAWSGSDWHRLLSGGGLPDLPGKTLLGGIALSLLLCEALRRWWRLPAAQADALFIGLPLAGAVLRVGCLCAGCCYGIPTGSSWGLCYAQGAPAFEHQVSLGLIAQNATFALPVFPVQVFMIVGNLLIFTALWHFRKKLSRPGSLALAVLALMMSLRFGVEFFREAATNRGATGLMWGGLKSAQWMCLLLALVSAAGFCRVQFFGKKTTTTTSHRASTTQQVMVLALIALSGLALRDLLTLDEKMVLLLSCAPALAVLARQVWQERRRSRATFAPAAMLSATTLVLLSSPLDSLAPHLAPHLAPQLAPQLAPAEWEQWVEVSAGNSFGSYDDVVRDCEGNEVRVDKIKHQGAGAEISSNWMRDRLKLQAGLRFAVGSAYTENRMNEAYNYDYSAYGLFGRLHYRWIGLSAGVSTTYYSYRGQPTVTILRPELRPSVGFRLGRLDRYSVDLRVFDEPVLGIADEPVVSFGLLNWGFDDPTGNTFLRMGMAFSSPGESAFHLSGRFPLGKKPFYGNAAFYFGDHVSLGQVGLRYRFGGR